MVNPVPAKSVDEQYESAMNYFQAKNYDKAIGAFSNIIFNFPGSRFAADAQYYLALSYFEKKDYDRAWQDVHKAEELGAKINPKFLEDLKKASGREK